MGIRKKKYDKVFIREAISLCSEPGVSASSVERDLGLYQGCISRWRREIKNDPVHAFPGTGNLKPEQDKIRQLEKEVYRLKRERDILKKAAAYFSMDSIKDSRS